MGILDFGSNLVNCGRKFLILFNQVWKWNYNKDDGGILESWFGSCLLSILVEKGFHHGDIKGLW